MTHESEDPLSAGEWACLILTLANLAIFTVGGLAFAAYFVTRLVTEGLVIP